MRKNEDAIFTIPNILSVVRILLLPIFFFLYIKKQFIYAAAILVASGLTDMLDGLIARKFDMITKLGKMLDPLADKITQASIAICLLARHEMLWPLLTVFCVKEALMLLGSYILLKKNLRPSEAKWWGKLNTVLMYSSLGLFLLSDIIPHLIPNWLLLTFMILALLSTIYSFFGYAKIYFRIQKQQ